ncbi:MAG: hypothetical protein HPY90_13520 [Syntrophothermus sp.]|uniref:hypothetical protein n=1 Tax=Syntrophothermus sp. TaxID=2736299 RepID=UPI00257D2114|nr:hypothetical protein [Syntrophothermus sp.]NSW84265.1 hypothetical protein [Syntrophothermus sp.]
MDTAFEQLETLSKKFKQNKKLNVRDLQVAQERLEELLMNPEYMEKAFKFIPTLPPAAVCSALLSAWNSCEAEYREKLLQQLLEDPALNTGAGCFRKILLIRDFISVDRQIALRLLIDTANHLTAEGKKVPVRTCVMKFREELLDSKKLLEIPLEKNSIGLREISGIAAMILIGMVEKCKNCTPEDIAWISDVLNWLGRCQVRAVLGQKLVAEAEKVTKNWPVGLQQQCIDLGLIRTLATHISQEQPAEETGQLQEHGVITVPREARKSQLKEIYQQAGVLPGGKDRSYNNSITGAKRESQDGVCTDWNARVCLEWLAVHIESLEKENETLRKNVDDLKQKLNLEKMHIIDREKQIMALQTEHQQKLALLDDLGKKISALEKETRELQNSLQKEKIAREEEVKRLKDRIDYECNYVIEEFKNRICDRLYPHYRFYLEARERPATEVADHLKYLLDRIFRELIYQGIGLNTESY